MNTKRKPAAGAKGTARKRNTKRGGSEFVVQRIKGAAGRTTDTGRIQDNGAYGKDTYASRTPASYAKLPTGQTKATDLPEAERGLVSSATMATTGEPVVVMTTDEYQDLLNRIEDAGDIALAAEARAEDAGKPTMPHHILKRELAGELSPLAAWRKSVKMTQHDLSAKSGVLTRTISEFENGHVDPRLSTLRALANAIGVGIEDIIPDDPADEVSED